MLKAQMARRGFLRLMGAAAAAPAAAEMQKASIAAGIDPNSLASTSGSIHDGPGGFEDDRIRAKIIKELVTKGLPEWKKASLWEDAREVRSLDPDLAANKSFSVAGKVHIQQQRNYERMVEATLKATPFEKERRRWLDKYGINWF